jgi:hypothetical protein
MAKRPSGRPDPMAREVDRLLAQLARASTDSEQERSTSHGNGGSPRPTSQPRVFGVRVARDAPSRGDLAALWGRVLLGAGLGVLMTQWPYSHACDLPLLGYLCAVGMVLLAGGWVAFESWRLRHGPAHIVSLILLFWGIVLAAEQLLPRIGYAAEPARWRCAAVTPSGTPSAAAPARTAAGRAR